MSEHLKPLFEKLEKARFTGTLSLRFERGEVASAELLHLLPFSQLGRKLVTVVPEEEFTLKF
jgi:hypothetical protein